MRSSHRNRRRTIPESGEAWMGRSVLCVRAKEVTMDLVDVLRKNALTAMKAKDAVATTILRLAQSEVQALQSRVERELTDDEAFGVIRKLVKSNQETLDALGESGERGETVRREIEILSALLPKRLSVAEIVAALSPVADAIKSAASDGQAMGVAMKHLKVQGAQVAGNDVSEAVKQSRAAGLEI